MRLDVQTRNAFETATIVAGGESCPTHNGAAAKGHLVHNQESDVLPEEKHEEAIEKHRKSQEELASLEDAMQNL
ncbi:hypothetical protein [Streptomyces sp. NPDC001948]